MHPFLTDLVFKIGGSRLNLFVINAIGNKAGSLRKNKTHERLAPDSYGILRHLAPSNQQGLDYVMEEK